MTDEEALVSSDPVGRGMFVPGGGVVTGTGGVAEPVVLAITSVGSAGGVVGSVIGGVSVGATGAGDGDGVVAV